MNIEEQKLEIEKTLKEKQIEIDALKERERVTFYAEVRQALSEIRSNLNETNKSVSAVQNWITIMGDTKAIKETLDDYKIFKAQIKTGIFIMNVIWGIAAIIIGWLIKK